MRNHDVFKRFKQKKYILWTDSGSNFRCAEFIRYLFDEVASEGFQICLNFFAECHGKSSRDAHFSIVDVFLKQTSYTKQITSTKEVNFFVNKCKKGKVQFLADWAD